MKKSDIVYYIVAFASFVAVLIGTGVLSDFFDKETKKKERQSYQQQEVGGGWEGALEEHEDIMEDYEEVPEQNSTGIDSIAFDSSIMTTYIDKRRYSIWASSTIESEDENLFSTENLYDLDRTTVWACHFEKGVHLRFSIFGTDDYPVMLTGVAIAGGNQKKETLLKRNSRPSGISVYLSNVSPTTLLRRFDLADNGFDSNELDFQYLWFDKTLVIKRYVELFVFFESVYQGSNWNDLYLTEAMLVGSPYEKQE